MPASTPTVPNRRTRPLQGLRVLSLALNLPGPAALQRLRALGARCLKIEPPARGPHSADPMQAYSEAAYADLHQGLARRCLDLKSPADRPVLERELARCDVLITAFRPSALARLGLGWRALHQRHPQLFQVAIVGAAGRAAERPGHDLTYQAEHDLVDGLALPASLYADMGGALLAVEAVLAAALLRRAGQAGRRFEVALGDAAAFLAQPRAWGLTRTGAVLGGLHAGYKVYACRDGRVALAALETHFAQRLIAHLGLPWRGLAMMSEAAVHQAVAAFMAAHSRAELDAWALEQDWPLHTLAA